MRRPVGVKSILFVLGETLLFSRVLWGMFAFGVVLVAVGFVPEVITARRLITLALKSGSVNAVQIHPA
jgi:hypothetical protein